MHRLSGIEAFIHKMTRKREKQIEPDIYFNVCSTCKRKIVHSGLYWFHDFDGRQQCTDKGFYPNVASPLYDEGILFVSDTNEV